jgi:hypothetical protein
MKTFILVLQFLVTMHAGAQIPDTILPVRGFCISAPRPAELTRFLQFINEELVPRKINTLVLRVDFNYQYRSHPELRDSVALSKDDVAQLVQTCKNGGIRLIPQINLLGHQSWAGTTHNLLRVYPEFDETPEIKMPSQYEWPNKDSLYCKSYCPLHPQVHKIVFDLVDEICDVFQSDAFHAGMDEVFYIGSDKCPRCKGREKSVLFAGEINKIEAHLKTKSRVLWIWGDRLINGRETGIGMWEASFNDTEPAVDLISKQVVICDWHYERPDKTAVYFAMKGFNVITCPWRNPGIALQQKQDMQNFRAHSTLEMKERFRGVMQTVWSGVTPFLDGFYQNSKDSGNGNNTPWANFTAIFPK